MVLVACLWPFDFWPANNVWWRPDNGGLHFESAPTGLDSNAGGVVFTPEPLHHPDSSIFKKGEISIELWLEPDVEQYNGGPRIVSFYDAHNTEKLIISQCKSYILAWLAPPDYRNQKPYREISAGDTMISGQANFVTFTSNRDGSFIYLNGEFEKELASFNRCTSLCNDQIGFPFEYHQIT